MSEYLTDEFWKVIFEGKLQNDNSIIGYRWENKESNCIVTNRTEQDENGVYGARIWLDIWCRNGRRNKGLLFPQTWTKEQVMTAVYKAFENRKVIDVKSGLVKGTFEGLDILFFFDRQNRLIDAMPTLSESFIKKVRRKRKKLKVCRDCKANKINVCVNWNCEKFHTFSNEFLFKCSIEFFKRKIRKFVHFPRRF